MNSRGKVIIIPLRITAGLLSFALGMLYGLQITPAFTYWRPIGLLVIAVACVQIGYGIAVTLRTWSTDQIGRRRPEYEAMRSAHRWYLAGMIGKFVLIGVLAAYLVGTGGRFGTPALAVLALAVEVVVLATLALLARSSSVERATGYKMELGPPAASDENG